MTSSGYSSAIPSAPSSVHSTPRTANMLRKMAATNYDNWTLQAIITEMDRILVELEEVNALPLTAFVLPEDDTEQLTSHCTTTDQKQEFLEQLYSHRKSRIVLSLNTQIERLVVAKEANPEFRADQDEELESWKAAISSFCLQCLERCRSYIPTNIFEMSIDQIQEVTQMPPQIVRRIYKLQCLWLVRLPEARILRLHISDLRARFDPSAYNLDIIELAGVYASLPKTFTGTKFDPTGAKELWRLTIEKRLQEMLIANDEGALPANLIRNDAYLGSQYGPIDDPAGLYLQKVVKSDGLGVGTHAEEAAALCQSNDYAGAFRHKSSFYPSSSVTQSASESNASLDDIVSTIVEETTELSLEDQELLKSTRQDMLRYYNEEPSDVGVEEEPSNVSVAEEDNSADEGLDYEKLKAQMLSGYYGEEDDPEDLEDVVDEDSIPPQEDETTLANHLASLDDYYACG